MSLPSILFFNLCWVRSIFSQPWIWLQVDHVSIFCCNSENNFKGTLVTVVMLGPRQYELVENVAVQDGWSVELRQRKGGKSEGQLYNVYVNPQRRLFYVLILANGLSSLGLLCFPQQVKGKCSIFFECCGNHVLPSCQERSNGTWIFRPCWQGEGSQEKVSSLYNGQVVFVWCGGCFNVWKIITYCLQLFVA